MSAKNDVYKLLSISNDIEAALKGPAAFARRMVRKAVYRQVGRGFRRIGW